MDALMVDMRDAFDEILPAAKIVVDLRRVLSEADGIVELEGEPIHIPVDTPLDVVARSAHAYEYAFGFGDHFRALVALGGVKGLSRVVPTPGICFATVWYSPDVSVSTVDFSRTMP